MALIMIIIVCNGSNILLAGYGLGSSGKLMNQYMIKDHMFSHYRKLYSAKGNSDMCRCYTDDTFVLLTSLSSRHWLFNTFLYYILHHFCFLSAAVDCSVPKSMHSNVKCK